MSLWGLRGGEIRGWSASVNPLRRWSSGFGHWIMSSSGGEAWVRSLPTADSEGLLNAERIYRFKGKTDKKAPAYSIF